MIKYFQLRIKKNWGAIFSLWLVLTMAFYIMDAAWSQWDVNNYYTTQNRELYLGDEELSATIISQMEDSFNPDYINLQAALYNELWITVNSIKEIKKFGTYSMEENVGVEDKLIEALFLAGDMSELVSINLKKGSLDSFIHQEEGKTNVLIGSDLGEQWKIGDEINVSSPYTGELIKCKVSGVLKRDSMWLAPTHVFSQKQLVNMNNMMLFNLPWDAENVMQSYALVSSGNFFFEAYGLDAYQNAVDKIRDAFRELSFKASIQNVEMQITNSEALIEENYGGQKTLAIIVTLVLCVYIMITIILQFLNRRREFGIAFLCGFTRVQLAVMQVIELGIVIVTSFVVALGIREFEYANFIALGVFDSDIIYFTHIHDTIPKIIFSALLIFCVCITVIFIAWKKTSVMDFIKSGRNV